jgi:hypothetical protein
MKNEVLLSTSTEIVENLSNVDKVDIKETFILTYENNTVYVILKEGFSNFIKFNNKSKEYIFIAELINFLFKYFNSTDIYESMYFKHFLILNKNKTK